MASPTEKTRTLLVLGCGSAGKRHARNFSSLGCRIIAFDPRPDRRQEAREIPGVAAATDSIGHAFATENLSGVVVCSPPAFHIGQALAAVRQGLPVLLEKPVSPTLGEAEELKTLIETTCGKLLLGYTYRWWPPVAALREKLLKGIIGKPLHARFTMSAHLADWHPWEHYQDFFMAHSELGGGALLDESHFIDLALWFFGRPETVAADIGRISDLDIDTDDNVDLTLRYPSGLRVVIHLDLFGRPHEKRIDITGTEGSVSWRDAENALFFGNGSAWEPPRDMFTCERNDMFTGVARDFLAMLDGDPRPPRCALADGLQVMEIIEAARQSSLARQTVKLG